MCLLALLTASCAGLLRLLMGVCKCTGCIWLCRANVIAGILRTEVSIFKVAGYKFMNANSIIIIIRLHQS